MRRVLAVLISVLTAVWPLLLPQPVSANPCSVNTMAENASVYAKAGHYINQAGDLYADNSGDAGKAYAGKGYGGQGLGGIASGGTGEGGYASNSNNQTAQGGLAVAAQVAVNAQDTENKAKNSSYANGGDGGTSYAGSLNAAIPVAAQLGAGNAVGGKGDGGDGGTSAAVPIGLQVPVSAGGWGGDGGHANGAANGNLSGNANGLGAGDQAGSAGLLNLLPIGNGSGNGTGNGGNGANNGNGSGNGGSADGGPALALQSQKAYAGDANGAKGIGGDADGYAKNSASSDIYSKTSAGSSDGGNGGDVWNKAGQNNEQHASNDDNSAYAKGGKNKLTSTNTASGGTGGAGGTANGTGGAGTGGSATGGSTAERTVGSNTKSVGDIAAVSTSVDVGGASGDPCKQIIKDSTGVMAVNGVNDIKHSVMQNSTTNLGNAANTSVNLGDLGNLKSKSYYGDTDLKGGAPNININPNNNQNTNIISF